MDYVLRKAKSADAIRIEELFVEMLRAVYHTDEAEGYKAGYLDKFFSDGEDWICVAEHENDVAAFLSIEVHRDVDYEPIHKLAMDRNQFAPDNNSAGKLAEGKIVGSFFLKTNQ